MTVHTETEATFDVPEAFDVPSLDGLPKVSAVERLPQQRMVATYFDTEDLRLLRNRVTLRRRTGGADAGWHMKLPSRGDDRLEVHADAGRGATRVPAKLESLGRAYIRRESLQPVVRLTTVRTVHRLLDSEGRVLAEVADDEVSALVGAEREPATWREVEVELVEGDRALLDAAGRVMRKAGARRAAIASKLGRALADRLAGLDAAGAPSGATATDEDGAAGEQARGKGKAKGKAAKGTTKNKNKGKGKASDEAGKGDVKPRSRRAGTETMEYVRRQVAVLTALDPLVRLDTDDAVHRMRVAARRLRSALQIMRPILDADARSSLDGELRWLGQVLTGVRDDEVLRERLRSEIAALPDDLVAGPVAATVDGYVADRRAEARRRAMAAMDSDRYLDLLDRLSALSTSPPLTPRADRPARALFERGLRRAVRRVERSAAAAEDAPTPDERVEALHDVRKAAKRARYIAEAGSQVLGAPARRFAARAEAVQEVLGANRDAVLAQHELVELAEMAHARGESTFTHGVLTALERRYAAEALAAYPDSLEAVRTAADEVR